MIVFGYNSFKIKAFSPQELGVPVNNDNEGLEIQVRQKYAHIFWIPFFPIGKTWVVKKIGTPGFYHATEEIKQLVKSQYKAKTPWYSYLLIFLALFIGGCAWVNEEIGNIRWENQFYENQANDKMRVKYPITGDFYTCEIYESKSSYESTRVIFKVNSYDEQTIEMRTKTENLYEGAGYIYDMTKEYAVADQYVFNSTLFTKDELNNLLTKEWRSYRDKKVKVASLGKFVSIEQVDRQTLRELN